MNEFTEEEHRLRHIHSHIDKNDGEGAVHQVQRLDDLVQADNVHLKWHDQTGQKEQEQSTAELGACARQCIPGHTAEQHDEKDAHCRDKQRVGKGTGKLHLLPSINVVLQIDSAGQRQWAGGSLRRRFQCCDDQIVNRDSPENGKQDHQCFGNDQAASFKFTRIH